FYRPHESLNFLTPAEFSAALRDIHSQSRCALKLVSTDIPIPYAASSVKKSAGSHSLVLDINSCSMLI
ncbi:MAG: hypothetical protein LBD55_04595, partial [Treponema sp.]|nr:hypothetical protein [Treponema sp.]